MMFFKSATPAPVLRLSVSSSGMDNSVAYGPGSVINGSILLKSSQPIHVQQLSIVFRCQVLPHQKQRQKQGHEQHPACLFSIVEHIHLTQQNSGIAHDDETTVISAGSHLHLFAIQLPMVNYPPTIDEAMFPDACYIAYTLEAFLDRPDSATLASDRVFLTYLPLVVAPVNRDEITSHVAISREHSFITSQNPGASIQIHARMNQSAYCLGEQCKIQLTTDNPTNDKINHIYVAFITRLSTHHHHQQHPSQHINYHQAIPISVPKQTKNHVSFVSVPIAQSCLPTFDYNYDQLGVALNVDHCIVIGLTLLHHHQSTESAPVSPTTTSSSSRFFSFGTFYGNANSSSTPSPLCLPITIVTIPTHDAKTPSVPWILQHDTANDSTSPVRPYFLSSKTSSPIPTGINNKDNRHGNDEDDDDDDGQYSVSPSSSFKLDDTCTTTDRTSATPPLSSSPLQSSALQQHHLTVPSHMSTST